MTELKPTKNWTYNEGKALIDAFSLRKDEYYLVGNKKLFWEALLKDLEAMGRLESNTTVEQVESKWRTMNRAYKNAILRAPGSPATKFHFMEEMDRLFKDRQWLSNAEESTHNVKKTRTSISMLRNNSFAEEKTCDTDQYDDKASIDRNIRKFVEVNLDEKDCEPERSHNKTSDLLETNKTVKQVDSKRRTLKSSMDRRQCLSVVKLKLMEEMDHLFNDDSALSSPYSISLGVGNNQPSLASESNYRASPSPEKKTALDIMEWYYNAKILEKKKKRKFMETYLEQKELNRERRHKEIMEILCERY